MKSYEVAVAMKYAAHMIGIYFTSYFAGAKYFIMPKGITSFSAHAGNFIKIMRDNRFEGNPKNRNQDKSSHHPFWE